MPSLPFFCCLLEEVDLWGYPVLYFFFVDAVLMCFACVETLCALELVHQSDVFYSSVLQFCCVVQFNLRRSLCGIAAPSLLEWHFFFSRVLRF